MAIPDFQTIMLPLLEFTRDGQDHGFSEAVEVLAKRFELNAQDLAERISSGVESKFHNRVSWACTYLKKAGLLESSGRGRFRLTDVGREVLRRPPARIDIRFLRQYAAFRDFQGLSNKPPSPDPDLTLPETPQEALEANYQSVRQTLAQELLARARRCSPSFFESLVVDLLVKMGYGGSLKDAGQAVAPGADGGIDGIIKEDKLGLDVVYLQAKRWEATVGRPIVQTFAGSLDGVRAKKGVLITTSQFSQEAKDYANRIEKRIVLIDGEQLAQLMMDYGIGVTEVASYVVKKVDEDYFGES